MRMLRVSFTEIYEDVFGLTNAYKKQVKVQTLMNNDRTMNSQIFNDILRDFEEKLKETCKYFTAESIIELKMDIVSAWLADCSMEFRK